MGERTSSVFGLPVDLRGRGVIGVSGVRDTQGAGIVENSGRVPGTVVDPTSHPWNGS